MPGRGPQRPITPGERTAPQPPLREDLAELTPLALEAVTEREAVAEWNEWVERYHPQGYRQPIGAHLRYFLLDRHGRKLGCLLFGFATRNLECRDTWIGWQGQAHRKHLDLVISNSRFLFVSLGAGQVPGVEGAGVGAAAAAAGLAAAARLPAGAGGDLR